MKEASASLAIKVQKTQARLTKVREPKNTRGALGEFLLIIDITALADTIYVPISIASGKKPTGFVYQIEGTAPGAISTTDISCRGEGISQVTLGTILYSKIPQGTTATFRIHVETRGKTGEDYKIVINKINYKHDPSDARYEKILTNLATENSRSL